MLIEALARLADRAGAERISIEIPACDGGECAVMVVTSLGQAATTGEDEEHGRLLAALSEPLVATGNVGELDSRVVRMIDSLEEDFVAAATTLPETDAQKKRRELKEAKEKPNKTEAKSPKKKASKKKAAKKDDSHAEALASGDANTL